MTTAFDFTGKTIVVTGAHDHIGARVCKDLISSNANVIGIGSTPYDESDLSKICSEAEQERYVSLYREVSETTDLERYVASIKQAVLQVVDGVALLSEIRGRDTKFAGETYEHLARFALTNYQLPACVAMTLAPRMNPGGSMVFLGSNETDMTMGDDLLFASSKAALIGVYSALTVQQGPRNVRVNMVSKGSVQNAARAARVEATPGAETLLERFEKRTPLGRSVTASEVSNAVLFLLSDASSGMTGANLHVDGGYRHALWDAGWPQAAMDVYKTKI